MLLFGIIFGAGLVAIAAALYGFYSK